MMREEHLTARAIEMKRNSNGGVAGERFFCALEARRLLSVGLDVNDYTLVIDDNVLAGTAGNDQIRVVQDANDASSLRLIVNGHERSFFKMGILIGGDGS